MTQRREPPPGYGRPNGRPAGRQQSRQQPSRQQPRAQPRAQQPRRAPQGQGGAYRAVGRPVGSASRPPARPVNRRPSRPRRQKKLRLGRLDSRLRYGFAAVCTLLVVIGGRLVQLQGIDHHNYADAAAAQRVFKIDLHAMRGSILDRNGNRLAYTSNAQDITSDPKQIKSTQRAHYAAVLAPLMHVSQTSVLTALNRPTQYALLATGLSPVTAQHIEALQLPGIYTQATTMRQYPGGTTASNVVGTVHSDGTGAAGIESEYNSILAGHNGTMTYSTDNVGNVNPSSRTVTTPARDGSKVKLTLDQNLQYMAQRDLDKAVPESAARGAQMAVLDVHTGQVLALASSGSFDAANPDTINPNEPIDPPVMSAFEPGSVQKAITFAAALQQKLITPQTQLRVPDSIRMGGVTINDAWTHKPEQFTATGVLAESSNVGTLKIAKRIGPDDWYRYEKLFGVGTKTGIELPGESGGYLPPRNTWSASTFANLPFGQGESMTVLQLASIYQTIANNGTRIPPRIVQSITKADGSVQSTKQPTGVKVVQPEVAKTVRTMLESVTQPGGTGVKAGLTGYRVAGKTGTAQQPDPAHGGAYSSYKNWDTFAGMVPADNPQFVVAIMVDNPAHGVEGGDVAAPLFHQIATYEVQHAQVPPTGSHSVHVPLQNCHGVNPATLPANVC